MSFRVHVVQRTYTPPVRSVFPLMDHLWSFIEITYMYRDSSFQWFSCFRPTRLLESSPANTAYRVHLDVSPSIPWNGAPYALSVAGRPVVRDRIGDYIIPSTWLDVCRVHL